MGQRPIEKERGRCPAPRLFLEKKEGKKNSRKRRFRQGDYKFLGNALLLGGRI